MKILESQTFFATNYANAGWLDFWSRIYKDYTDYTDFITRIYKDFKDFTDFKFYIQLCDLWVLCG